MKLAANLPTWLQPQPETNHWLAAYRQRHWEAVAKTGLPTARQERWKYADLSFLAKQTFVQPSIANHADLADKIASLRIQQADTILLVMVNGHFSAALSDLRHLPPGVIISNLTDAIHQQAALIQATWKDEHQNIFASINAAMFTDGLFVSVPDNTVITTPIHCVSLAIGDEAFIAQPKRLIVLGEQSQLTLVDEHAGVSQAAYLSNTTTHLVIGKTATLTHYKIQHEGEAATHIANTFVQQAQDSALRATYFSTGANFARDEVTARLTSAGAVCSTGGYYYLTRDNQYVDYHIDVDHAAPRSQSEMLFKGVLKQKSRAVFNGRLHVIKDAQKITAYQANHNILLSNQAEVYSKPELEIDADDVKCKHGATIGQLDEEALFYLRSRGIDQIEATNILLKGFAEEVLQRVHSTAIRAHIEKVMMTL